MKTILFWLPRSILFFNAIVSLSWGLLENERNNIEVYKKANPAVVNITTVTLRRDFFFEVYPQSGVGSGVLVRPSGYIVTNDHVVGGAQKILVTLSDKTEYQAKVVGRDPDTDLAVLKIESKGKSFPHVSFAKGDLEVGQKVLAIGNPFGLGGSLTVGVISSLGRDIRATTNRTIKDIIQTDAAINPGNSGGPLLDSDGNIIGINSQIASAGGGSDGIGFAIDVKHVKRITEQLITYGQVLRPYMGVEGVGFPGTLLEFLGIPSDFGIMLTRIAPKSPAAKAGLRAADKEKILNFRRIPVGGDVIYKVDNTNVETMSDLVDYIFKKKIGDKVTLHFMRGSKKRSVEITLGLPPGIKLKSM